MSGGGGHTCALRDDGSTWCWGWNPYGQVGDGTRENRLVAVITYLHAAQSY
ncbi:hypothetical protein [Sorangium sp. So ce233]|uniref:hypothetical protein n=1 Tax=Sorangium sp. So ce233 TaxID=3133290 RepID=UPI003F5FDF5B